MKKIENRTMTRAEWKACHRYVRVCNRKLREQLGDWFSFSLVIE